MKKDISKIETYEVGDIIMDKNGSPYCVLAVSGKGFLISARYEFAGANQWYTAEDMVKFGAKFIKDYEANGNTDDGNSIK